MTKSSHTVPSSRADGRFTEAAGPASTSGAMFPAAGQSVPVRFTKVSIPPGDALTFVSRMLALASGSEASPAKAHGVVIASSVAPDGIVSATTWYGYPANASFAMTRWCAPSSSIPWWNEPAFTYRSSRRSPLAAAIGSVFGYALPLMSQYVGW